MNLQAEWMEDSAVELYEDLLPYTLPIGEMTAAQISAPNSKRLLQVAEKLGLNLTCRHCLTTIAF